jgi:hypothetical protein
MSPVTHFLTGWVLANCARLERKDRALVTLACVAPDVDGLGIIPELLTRNSSHPLLWFSMYHHSLHNLAFALVVAVIAFVVASQKWKTGLLALLAFHVHLFEDILGSRGPEGYQWPRAVLFVGATHLARTMGPECVAEYRDHDSTAADHFLAGVAERILATGNGVAESRQFFRRRAPAAFSGLRSNFKPRPAPRRKEFGAGKAREQWREIRKRRARKRQFRFTSGTGGCD